MGLNGDKRYPYTMLPYMQLTQSNKYRGFRMIEELAVLIRANRIQAYVDVVDDRGRITGGGRRNYETARITIRAHRNVTGLLRKLIPHMITRKQTAQDLLRFLTIFPPRTGPDAGVLRGRSIGLGKLGRELDLYSILESLTLTMFPSCQMHKLRR